jgi:hypothetical protein
LSRWLASGCGSHEHRECEDQRSYPLFHHFSLSMAALIPDPPVLSCSSPALRDARVARCRLSRPRLPSRIRLKGQSYGGRVWHEISGLRLAAAPSPAGRPGWPGKDLSAASPNKDAIRTARVDTGQAAALSGPARNRRGRCGDLGRSAPVIEPLVRSHRLVVSSPVRRATRHVSTSRACCGRTCAHKAFTTAVARRALSRCRPDPGPSRGGHRSSKSRLVHVRYLR